MSADYEDPTTWLHSTAGGINYRLVSREGSFEDDGAQARETYILRASDLLNFANESFPLPLLPANGFPQWLINRRMPGLLLPTKRVSWKGHVDGLPVDPFGVDPNAPSGRYQPNLEVTIEYGNGDNKHDQDENDPEDPETFLEITANAAGEFIHTTGPKAKWVHQPGFSAGQEVQNRQATVPVVITVPETEWTVRWSRVPRTYFNETLIGRIRSKLGTVNQAAMPLFVNAPAETILFLGYNLERAYNWRPVFPDIQPFMTLEFKFLEKYIISGQDDNGNDIVRGHNDFWKADVGWQRLLIDGTNPPYKSSNLSQIFAK